MVTCHYCSRQKAAKEALGKSWCEHCLDEFAFEQQVDNIVRGQRHKVKKPQRLINKIIGASRKITRGDLRQLAGKVY